MKKHLHKSQTSYCFSLIKERGTTRGSFSAVNLFASELFYPRIPSNFMFCFVFHNNNIVSIRGKNIYDLQTSTSLIIATLLFTDVYLDSCLPISLCKLSPITTSSRAATCCPQAPRAKPYLMSHLIIELFQPFSY